MFELGLPDGAYYLAGYAVECALKACIAKATVRHEFPDKKRADSSYTHSIRELVRTAGLEDSRREKVLSDAEFRKHWDAIVGWTEHSRYGRHDQESAEAIMRAVSDPRHGVMSWLKRHW